MKKFVYSFNEGSKDMKNLLGGKGANLAEMTKIGLPVPFGFTITTEECTAYSENGGILTDDVVAEIDEKLAELENVRGKKLGDAGDPLLVSVRSGAPISMPGMMDTILNLGLNDETVRGLAAQTGNERFAMDSYRRFIQMFGNVVMEVPMAEFNGIFDGIKNKVGARFDVDLGTEDLREIIAQYQVLYKNTIGKDFPQDPHEQLMEAVKAVFRSWNNDRAILYRKLNRIPDDLGTAVNVQSMVFGNMGDDSGTGVCFSRDPATGENKWFYGEYLIDAQGEDVVAGIRTPQQISIAGSRDWAKNQGISEEERRAKYPSLEESMPEAYRDLLNVKNTLEKHYHDMQDMEFTIEHGKLFMLQTRNGKRTALAAVNIAVDMVNEGLIDKETAVMRVDPESVDQLLHPKFDAAAEKQAVLIAKGLPASPGAASGNIYFTATDAEAAVANGEKAVLVREETSPEDLAGMVAAEGILTARGGMTSHAAVVARGMGKCCVAGCSEIRVSESDKTMKVGDKVYHEGDGISLNGFNGSVYEGTIGTVPPELAGNFGTIMSWADGIRTLKIRTNADTPRDARQAIAFGAEGIGLTRTEHMFFDEERIPAIRRMIVADTYEERKSALDALLPYQKGDFKGIYEAMEDRPVTIRLLDPPLHEFLPKTDEETRELSEQINVPYEKLQKATMELHEFNPMLGHRGCRLAVTYPEIAEMQTRAIIEAAIEVRNEKGYDIVPEIMIPLTCIDKEFQYVRKIVVDTAEACKKEKGSDIQYMVGTMIEVPRAALTADEIAKDAEFFSFGTNDLTQMTFGFSRDDTGKIIKEYVDKGIFKDSIFETLDQDGVGKLVDMAAKLGRKARPNIKLGICGEHGGDPRSIEFCHRVGLNYVSCSPYRVPVARLAAAQAAVKAKEAAK